MADEIVVDTGPLIAFASIGRLDLVRKIFSKVLIPEAVRNEVFASGGTRPGADVVAAASWLETITVSAVEPLLSAELGAGEAEVISLAASRPGAAVLIDERRGRRIAETVYRLTVRGTVGTLVVAKKRNLVDEIHPLLDDLTRCGYRLAPSLIDAACRAAGEL